MIRFETYDKMWKMPSIGLKTKSVVSSVFLTFRKAGTSLRLSAEPRDMTDAELAGAIASQYAFCLMRRGINPKQIKLALELYLLDPPEFLPVPGAFVSMCELMPR